MREKSNRLLGAVAACLVLSGTGSLVLEVCWSRLLKLVFGSTTLAISTILVAYMLGLGLGGLFGGRIARRLRNGVRAYGWMELGIAAYALFVPLVLGFYPLLNRSLLFGLGFWPAAFVRFVLSLVVLILPTILMGATLPVLVAALAGRNDQVARNVGLLYGMNTLGAVAGTLLGTFVFFPALGLAWTNAAGALMDGLAGLLALAVIAGLVGRVETPPAEPKRARAAQPSPAMPLARWNPLLLSYGLVGLTALTYEVCWTRALTMVFGSSIYAFSTMLAAFLLGLALGSLVARRWFDGLRQPVRAYALGLALLGILSVVTALSLNQLTTAFLDLLAWFGLTGPISVFASFGLSIAAMLGPTLVLGALFPLIVRALTPEASRASSTVGDVYFLNTIGSASGAFLAGFLLIPWLGLARTMALAAAVNLLTAAAVLAWQVRVAGGRLRLAAAATGLAGLALLVWSPGLDTDAMTRGVYYRPRSEMEFGLPWRPFSGVPLRETVFYRDGVSAAVSIHREPGGLTMRINGKVDASLMDMPTQALSGHLPFLFGKPAKRALVIGYASGVTSGAVTLWKPERLDIVEIEPAVIEASHHFDEYNHRPLDKPYVRLIVDDGRTFITTTPDTYDVIISEPSNPFLAGCSNLFTREFFAAARQRLNSGGRLLQWIQLYGMDPDGLRAVLSALTSAFPNVYAFHYSAENADLLLMATDEALGPTDLASWESLDEDVRSDLERVQIASTADIWSLMRLVPAEVVAIAREAPVQNSDDSMYVELHAPWVLSEAPTRNLQLLAKCESGVLPVADSRERPLGADDVGLLALSYLQSRDEPLVARRYMDEAARRGESGAVLAAQAFLLRREGKAADAAAALDRAVELSPTLFEPRFHRARSLVMAGRFEEALADAAVLERTAPADARLLSLRQRALASLGRWDEARAAGERLLATSSAQLEPFIWIDVASTAAATGDLDRAITLMERTVAWRPLSTDDWRMLAALYEKAGRSQEAAIARSNYEVSVRNNLIAAHRDARFEARFGSADRARQLLQAILARDPNNDAARADLRKLTPS